MVLILDTQLLAYLESIWSDLVPENCDDTFECVDKAFHFELTHNPKYFLQSRAEMSFNHSFIAWNFE